MNQSQPAVLTVDEAHTVIGKTKISTRSLYNALHRNEIPHIRLGKRFLIPRHAFNKWLEGAGMTGEVK